MFLKTVAAAAALLVCVGANAAVSPATGTFAGGADNTFSYVFGSDGTFDLTVTGFNFDISNVTISGFGGLSWSTVDTTVSGFTIETWTLNPGVAMTASTMYDVSVTGTNSGGAYAGSHTFTAAAPVPEPESYAMLLAGLGALGFMGRRRGSKAAKA
ncbi:MAG: FxDxF family PEP-CTERM protein [Burkholderiales bacterium]|nr:FxDxF family PEP-CTERM protein [Burkholderiales bacterium]